MGKDDVADAVAWHDEMVDDYNRKKAEKMTGELCAVCATPLYSDPGPHELGIYLHALAYADVDGAWRHTSPMPEWTRPPDDQASEVMESPAWDYAALGEDAMMLDLDKEKEKEQRNNRKGMAKNREMQVEED